jgi:hypothetical protein
VNTGYGTTAKKYHKELTMKKLIAGAMLLGASTLAFAQPGCGVGAMIWKGQPGIAPHVLAATTNGTFGNQTFGMTTQVPLGVRPANPCVPWLCTWTAT